MRAKEIMRKKVVTAPPEMTLRELAKLFIEKRITGAPVVDHRGRLLGVVSQTDLVRRDREKPAEIDVPGYYREGEKSAYAGGYQIEDPDFTRVKDIMTPAVLSADEAAPVAELARCMLAKHIHRVVITHQGKLCGIVTSMDMLKAFLAMTEEKERVRA